MFLSDFLFCQSTATVLILRYCLMNTAVKSAVFLVPAVGLEPTRGYPQQILSLHRLPFRHAGVQLLQFTIGKILIQGKNPIVLNPTVYHPLTDTMPVHDGAA